MDPQLWAWVDRVIYDSQQWSDFRAQMERVRLRKRSETAHPALRSQLDALVQLRLALAQFFDCASSRARFEEIKAVRDRFRASYRSTALPPERLACRATRWTVRTKTKENTLALATNPAELFRFRSANKAAGRSAAVF